MRRSLENLAYVGTCCIASRRDKFICTYLNSSSISFILMPFLSRGRGDLKVLKNGAFGVGARSTGSFLSIDSFFSGSTSFDGSGS